MNTSERMIELYQERIDGYEHECYCNIENIFIPFDSAQFYCGGEYRKIEKFNIKNHDWLDADVANVDVCESHIEIQSTDESQYTLILSKVDTIALAKHFNIIEQDETEEAKSSETLKEAVKNLVSGYNSYEAKFWFDKGANWCFKTKWDGKE